MSIAKHEVIKRPMITEKSTVLREKRNTYVFEVNKAANKADIKSAVESLFDVKVATVNTIVKIGKVKRVGRSSGRQSTIKKAYVALKEGSVIDFENNAK